MNNENEEKMEDRKDIVVNNKGELMPRTFEQMLRIAQMISVSSFCPSSYGKDKNEKLSNVMGAIMYGAPLGMSPMQAIQWIAFINGKAALWGDAQLALARASGELEVYTHKYYNNTGDEVDYSHEIDGDAFKVVVEVKRKGKDLVKQSFSVADAKKAGLWNKGGTWSTHPKRMLMYKPRSFLIRDEFTDVLGGMHTIEELEGEVIDISPNKKSEELENLILEAKQRTDESKDENSDVQELINTSKTQKTAYGIPIGESV